MSDDPGRTVDPEAFPIERGQLDLAPMVREEVLLGVPDAPLCRDDCAGICPECGADLAAGPCGCDARCATSAGPRSTSSAARTRPDGPFACRTHRGSGPIACNSPISRVA